MIMILSIILLATVTRSAVAVSSVCSNRSDECDSGRICIGNTVCSPDGILQYPAALFAAGVASQFIRPDTNDSEMDCLVSFEGDIDDFLSALQDWQNGDYVQSGEQLLTAVSEFKSVLSQCISVEAEDSFWDELWKGVQFVIAGLCSECEAVITAGEYVVQGVDIIDDVASMIDTCGADQPSADDFINCGYAFGDSIKRIASIA